MNKIAFSTATYLTLRERLMAAEPGLDEQTLAAAHHPILII